MEEKLKFIKAWESGAYTVSALCEAHGISRTTGHQLIKRYLKEGVDCLEERSKRPRNIPHKTPEKIEQAIVKLRSKHKNWGARKLMVLLLKEFSATEIPSENTVNKILSRHGLVKRRKRRPQKITPQNPKHNSSECNEIWSADYKGKFRMGNGRYCYPLTITDKFSRYLFEVSCHYKPNYEAVKRGYIKVFRQHGQPLFIHTDNGSPFGSVRSVKRYSRLCYWLIDHGIEPLFSDPGCPQQNGRHERMHKDLKADCTKPPRSTLASQQRRIDAFVKEYNEIRPHESLDMATPGSVYESSPRPYQQKVKAYCYDGSLKVLKVMKNGAIRWGGHDWVFVSEAAIGRYMGMEEIGNGIWKMYYRHVFLGYFDEKQIDSKTRNLKLTNSIV
jgi:transposase InsO family protein